MKGKEVQILCDQLSVCASKLLCPSVKTGHWETEKAGHSNADFLLKNLYGVSHKTCFDIFLCQFMSQKNVLFLYGKHL